MLNKFKNKTAAIKYYKQYLLDNEKIPGADYDEIKELCSMHYCIQNSNDIKQITIEYNKEYGKYKNFTIYFNDDSFKQLSVNSIFNGYNHKENINKQLRMLILSQITEFKNNNKIDVCPICGKTNKQWDCDHHEPKFRDIIINFMDNYGLSYETMNVDEISDLFIDYHKNNAKLRIICHSCNLKLH